MHVPDSNYLPRYYNATDQEQGDVIDVPTFQSFIIVDLSLEAGGSISGTVKRRVDSSPVGRNQSLCRASDFRASANTNSEGRYIFRGLYRPDHYRLHVVALDENYVSVYFDDAIDPAESVSLALERQQRITGIDFRLRYGGVISGRVYARRIVNRYQA